jgi:hypothetical protein
MKKSLVLFLMMSLAVFGYEATSINIEFTAFKTPAKIGVKGGFDTIELSGKKNAETIEQMLEGLSATIETKSVNSGNQERDQKLVNAFFHVQFNHKIKAKIVSVQGNSLVAEIMMNQKSVQVPMHYTVNEKSVSAEGYIDLWDFDMLPSLRSINKACYDLHSGKTWQDVIVTFTLEFQ